LSTQAKYTVNIIIAAAIISILIGFAIGYVLAPGKVVEKEVPKEVVKYVTKTTVVAPDFIVTFKGAKEPTGELIAYSDINPAYYKDKYLSALIYAAKYESDPQLREKLYNAIQALSQELVPVIWIGQAVQILPQWNWVHNLKYHPLIIYKFSEVYKDPDSPHPDTLIFARESEPRSLDPAVSYEGPGWTVMHQIYETLVTYYTNETSYVVPALAAAWAYSPDGLNWYFAIKGDKVFYDPWDNTTYPLTAEDVVYSIERVIAMNQGPSWIISQFTKDVSVVSEDEFKSVLSDGLKTFFKDKSIEVHSLDELLGFFGYKGKIAGVVKLTLKKPYGAVLACLASTPGSIVSKTYVEKHGGYKPNEENKWMYDHPVGTGPYYLKEWVHNQYVELAPNPYYNGPDKPKIPHIIIKVIPDVNSRILMLKKGDADAADIPRTLLSKIKGVTLDYNGKTWNLQLTSTGLSFNILYIVPNAQREPFNNVLVRQALAHAIPYNGILEKVYNNTYIKLNGVLPKGMFGYTDNVKKYEYNITKAKELLAKAGYPNGLNAKISMLVVQGFKDWEMVATILQQSWKELGIDLQIQELSWPVEDQKIEHGDFDIYIMTWGPDFLDPDDYAFPLLTGGYTFDEVTAVAVKDSSLYNITIGKILVGGN